MSIEVEALRPPSVLFGVPLDDVTMPEALDRLDTLIRAGRSTGRSHQVTTVNVDFLVNALEQPDLLSLLQNSSLSLADGMPVLWGSSMIGTPLRERVTGADLVPLLAQESAERGWRVHFFGGGAGVADRAKEMMLDSHPTALITVDEGPMVPDPADVAPEVIEAIRAVDADIVCVALGNPKQERFIAANRDAIGAPVMIGIGGSLDMLVGDKRRAPEWARRSGTEWIFRAAQEPRRLGVRYARDLRLFGPAFARFARGVRRYRSGAGCSVESDGGQLTVRVAADVPDVALPASSLDLEGVDRIRLDFGAAVDIGPHAHAAMVGVVRAAVLAGIPVDSSDRSTAMQACLGAYGTSVWLEEVLIETSSDSQG